LAIASDPGVGAGWGVEQAESPAAWAIS